MLEKQLIKKYKTTNPKYGYNRRPGGDTGILGHRHTHETRSKISISTKKRNKSTFKKDFKAREKYSKIAKEQKRHVIDKPPRKVIDKYGNIYESIREASEILKVNYSTLRNYLVGRRKDKIGVRFYE